MGAADEPTWDYEAREPKEELVNYVKIANRLFMRFTLQNQHPVLIQRAYNIEWYITKAIEELAALEKELPPERP